MDIIIILRADLSLPWLFLEVRGTENANNNDEDDDDGKTYLYEK